MKKPTPEWLVERLHQGDLSPAEAEAVRERLSEEGSLSRLDALARDDARFAEAHPPGPAVGEIRRRAAASRRPRARQRRIIWTLAPLAAAAVAVLVLRLPGEEVTRPKGLSPHLAVHRQRAGTDPEVLDQGARAQAGDVLQLSVVSAGQPYGVVVSVDGRGVVTRHGPGNADLAAKLSANGAVPLDHSYQLDDAPAFERFFLITGSTAFEVEPVLDAIRRLAAAGGARTGAPALPEGLSFSDFTLEKKP